MAEENVIALPEPGYLMVCLCDHGNRPAGHVAGVEVCETHQAASLQKLLEAGWHAQLHVMDESGKIVPVTAAMLRG